jgi:ABC-2 type transport system ATP-binding protein
MRLIMGLDAATSGYVHVNGRPYRDLPWPLRAVGGLLEANSFHPGRSAYHHLLALAQANEIPRARVDEVLDIVGLARWRANGWERSRSACASASASRARSSATRASCCSTSR